MDKLDKKKRHTSGSRSVIIFYLSIFRNLKNLNLMMHLLI
jgi:hypothetical protein